MKLTSIELLGGNLSPLTVLPAPEGFDFASQLIGGVQITDSLGEFSACRLRVQAGSPAATAIGEDGLMWLSARRVLRVTLEGESETLVRLYRIREARRDLSARGQPLTVSSESALSDAQAIYPRRLTGEGGRGVDRAISLSGLTAAQAASQLLSSELGCPATFASGAHEGVALTARVELETGGEASLWALLEEIARQAGCEIESEWDAGTSRYLIRLVDEIGRDASESAAPTPNRRPISLAPGGGNRRSLTRVSSAGDFFSRIVPYAEVDGGTVGIAHALARILEVSYDEAEDETLIRFDAAGTFGNWPAGQYLYPAGGDGDLGLFITRVVSADTLAVPGDERGSVNVVLGSRWRVASSSSGAALDYIEDPAAVQAGGVSVRMLPVSASPYENLLSEQGVTSDLSVWEGDPLAPRGVSPIVDAVVTRVLRSDPGGSELVKHGTSSARVEADAGDGVAAIVELDPTGEQPFASFYAHVRTLSGSVRLELVDSEGVVHPKGERAGSSLNRLVEVGVGGTDAAAGQALLRIVAETDGTAFVLDAWTLTHSPSAWPYQEAMGPRAIYAEGARVLYDEGGIQADSYEGSALTPGEAPHFSQSDLGVTAIGGGTTLPVRLGSHVRVRDAWSPQASGDGSTDAGAFEIDFTSRVARVTYTATTMGQPAITFVLSYLKKAFTDLFRYRPRRSEPFRVPNEDRGAVLLSADRQKLDDRDVVVRVSARAVRGAPCEIVETLAGAASGDVIGTTGAGGTFVSERRIPMGAAAYAQYEARLLGVAMSEAVRVPIPAAPPTITATKTQSDDATDRIVQASVTITGPVPPGYTLIASIAQGPPATRTQGARALGLDSLDEDPATISYEWFASGAAGQQIDLDFALVLSGEIVDTLVV